MKKTIYVLAFYLDEDVTIMRFQTAESMQRHYDALIESYGEEISMCTSEIDII